MLLGLTIFLVHNLKHCTTVILNWKGNLKNAYSYLVLPLYKLLFCAHFHTKFSVNQSTFGRYCIIDCSNAKQDFILPKVNYSFGIMLTANVSFRVFNR